MTMIAASCALLTSWACGLTDHRTGRMPNWLTLGSLSLALVHGALAGSGRGWLGAVLGATVVALAPLVVFFATRGRGLGGGDVKVFAALGAWLGAEQGMQVVLWGLCSLAIVALASDLRTRVVASRAAALTRSPKSATFKEWRVGPFLAASCTLSVALQQLGAAS